jgi:hypothetical protein
MRRLTAVFFFSILALASWTQAQTTGFTYQGLMQISAAPANGSFDFEFALFDGGGVQIGPTLTRSAVSVASGIFSVNLDFGAGFPGATRFLEIRVRPAGGGTFTNLSPRQPVTSSPYSIKSLTADTADNAVNAANALTATNFSGNLAGDVTGTQIATTVARLQNRNVANTPPLDGQVLKFNAAASEWRPDTDNTASGGGTITGVTAGTGLTGGGATGNVTLSIANAGVGTTQLADGGVTDAKINSVSGAKVTGTVASANNANQLGGIPATGFVQNSTNPQASSNFNISGNGTAGGTLSANIVNAATQFNINGNRILSSPTTTNLFAGFGAGATTTGTENSFFGNQAGEVNTSGFQNSIFGSQAGRSNLGNSNSFFGRSAGRLNAGGGGNSFFGWSAGQSNIDGTGNTLIGTLADVAATNLTNATAIGFRAHVGTSDSLVLGSIAGLNGASSDTNVGIGTAAPTQRLHVVGNALFAGNLQVTGTLTGTLPAGSGNYIQNQNSAPQASSNFNISGNGSAGGTLSANIVNAGSQFNLGNNRIISASGLNNFFAGIGAGSANTGFSNTFVGRSAGEVNTSGEFNAFFGRQAGSANTTGGNNAFFGASAGDANTTGSSNAFFGTSAGGENTTGNSNTFLGQFAGNDNTTGSANTMVGAGADATVNNLSNATAIGFRAAVSQSNSLILGSINGVNFGTADTNVGIGTTAPSARVHVVGPSSAINAPVAILQSSGTQVPLSLRSGANEAIIRSDNGGNLVLATVAGTDKDIYFRAGDDAAATDMFIESTNGNIGIATTTPDQKLSVNGNASKSGGGSWLVFSDERLKNIKGQFNPGLKAVMKLQPRRYEYKHNNMAGVNSNGEHVGFSAQEVEKILPEAVTKTEQGIRLVNNDPIILAMLNAIKEQQATIEKLSKQVRSLQRTNAKITRK